MDSEPTLLVADIPVDSEPTLLFMASSLLDSKATLPAVVLRPVDSIVKGVCNIWLSSTKAIAT
ncbi:hypothetical protein [Burkholderia gladioli]|uniref:hypothetical protein n=1 Tax=Burkholderia gladioli TaxID=28095 RepID=UPI001FC86633|nr:hypothetical protein [Burkholderia gladioli]